MGFGPWVEGGSDPKAGILTGMMPVLPSRGGPDGHAKSMKVQHIATCPGNFLMITELFFVRGPRGFMMSPDFLFGIWMKSSGTAKPGIYMKPTYHGSDRFSAEQSFQMQGDPNCATASPKTLNSLTQKTLNPEPQNLIGTLIDPLQDPL